MSGPIFVTVHQLIELIGGIILLIAAYYAVMARRSEHPAYRRAYGRAVLQYAAAFLVFAYTTYVLLPESHAWPVQTGAHLWQFFQQMDTVPDHVNGQLTDYYAVLLQQIGMATGATPGLGSGILGTVEATVRTIGLVVYTIVFALVSLGAQVPARVAEAVNDALPTDTNMD